MLDLKLFPVTAASSCPSAVLINYIHVSTDTTDTRKSRTVLFPTPVGPMTLSED